MSCARVTTPCCRPAKLHARRLLVSRVFRAITRKSLETMQTRPRRDWLPRLTCRSLRLRRCGLEARCVPERLGAVGALPGEVVVGAAEVAVGCGLLEDRAVEV